MGDQVERKGTSSSSSSKIPKQNVAVTTPI
jgi:hypothetical protein